MSQREDGLTSLSIDKRGVELSGPNKELISDSSDIPPVYWTEWPPRSCRGGVEFNKLLPLSDLSPKLGMLTRQSIIISIEIFLSVIGREWGAPVYGWINLKP